MAELISCGEGRKYDDIAILYEDKQIIVVNKPSGILSQADDSGAPDMVNLLKEYLKREYRKPGAAYLGLVQRLDRPVSGSMVFAKTSKSASRLSEQIRNGRFTKKYRAVTGGKFSEPRGVAKQMCLKDVKTNKTAVFPCGSAPASAKPVYLEYSVSDEALYGGETICLIEIILGTGRSHQIRAQMGYMGHPLLGDRKYGDRLFRGDICLQSYFLSFSHPVGGKYMEFQLPRKDTEPWNVFKE